MEERAAFKESLEMSGEMLDEYSWRFHSNKVGIPESEKRNDKDKIFSLKRDTERAYHFSLAQRMSKHKHIRTHGIAHLLCLGAHKRISPLRRVTSDLIDPDSNCGRVVSCLDCPVMCRADQRVRE